MIDAWVCEWFIVWDDLEILLRNFSALQFTNFVVAANRSFCPLFPSLSLLLSLQLSSCCCCSRSAKQINRLSQKYLHMRKSATLSLPLSLSLSMWVHLDVCVCVSVCRVSLSLTTCSTQNQSCDAKAKASFATSPTRRTVGGPNGAFGRLQKQPQSESNFAISVAKSTSPERKTETSRDKTRRDAASTLRTRQRKSRKIYLFFRITQQLKNPQKKATKRDVKSNN